MHRPSLVKIHCYLHMYCPQMKKKDVWQADNSFKKSLNLPITSPKPDLYNTITHTKFCENPLIFTCYRLETKIWMDRRMDTRMSNLKP